GQRLPTIAEWEAVMAKDPDEYNKTHHQISSHPGPVRQEAPNSLGLFDMNTLVWEWVYDFNSSLVTGDARSDGSADIQLFCGSQGLGINSTSDYESYMRYALRSS